MVRQVLQGGGNMPAYGNALNPSETTALVRFLTTLRGNDLPPATDASRHLVLSSETPGTPMPPRAH
jgi:ubiquinol-cytochrome c reductase cytochrome b subunit